MSANPPRHPDAPAPENCQAHWRHNRRWILGSLLVWFTVSFGAIFFARSLSFKFFGWPFSFWLAAQGSLLVYLALVVLYARTMSRLETRLELDELE